MPDFSHKALCDLAVNWLQRPYSRGGPGCSIAISEAPSGWVGEIPDAFGVRAAGHQDGTVVVEVKTSRSDFLADKRKPHRSGDVLGLGRWRYYMCPQNLIKPEELPEKWGLLYVTARGGVKPIVGPGTTRHYHKQNDMLDSMAFIERDIEREIFLLARILNRIGDAEKLNQRLRAAERRAGKLASENEALRKEVKAERLKKLDIMRQLSGESEQAIPRLVR
jgi:hypothetical protein